MEELRDTVVQEFGDEIWTAVKAGLGVIGSLSINHRENCLTLIFEGASGRGKSSVINLLSPDRPEARDFLYRLDKFTPKSFVTHSASIPAAEIKNIDLLPQITNKTLLVKELAPLFRGRDQELTDTFATLTAILDGRGFKSSSGVRGTRGYEGQYAFNWLGATTPIPAHTDAIMAQLGNRLLRYEIVGQDISDEELMEYAENGDSLLGEVECRKAVNDYLISHFQRHPINSFDQRKINFEGDAVRQLVNLAKLISHGRVEISQMDVGEEEPEVVAGLPEGPHRVIQYLRTILKGLALVSGRERITDEDLNIIRHIAFSSLPSHRRQVLRALLVGHGMLDSKKAEETLGISRPTARAWMKELAATAIASWTEGKGNQPDMLTLGGKWGWLLPPREEQNAGAPDESAAESDMRVCVTAPAESN